MPKLTQQERREKQAVLKALGVKSIEIIHPPKYHRQECAICLKQIKKGEQLKLECGHVFHGECMRKWATKDNPTGQVDMLLPVRNRKIHLFKEGENIMTCPCCRTEYTHDVYTAEIKKVLAKIHVHDNNKKLVHYITDMYDTMEFVPKKEFDDNYNVNGKWATILALLKKAWETGDTDIYAVKRTSPEEEFVLTNDHFILPPLDKTSGLPKQQYVDGTPLFFEIVNVEELKELLN